jgi:hypothetical protein
LLDQLGDSPTELLAKQSEAMDVFKSQGSQPVLLYRNALHFSRPYFFRGKIGDNHIFFKGVY